MIENELEEARQWSLFRDYVGQASWHVTTIKHAEAGTENDMPQYITMAHPEKKLEEQSAQEIISGVLEKLG